MIDYSLENSLVYIEIYYEYCFSFVFIMIC